MAAFMWISTITSRVIETLGEERRRVVSSWRILMLARRIARLDAAPLPDYAKGRAIETDMLRRSALNPVTGLHGIYTVDVPFAKVIPISDEQIVQEANPWCVFSHLTAFVVHGITDQIPSTIHASDFAGSTSERIPLGTEPDDWVDVQLPTRKLPSRVRDINVDWTRSKSEWDFGTIVSYSQGIAIYVSDLERTLLDSLRYPEKCGGILAVIRAWQSVVESGRLDIEKLVGYTDRLDVAVVRQRIGFFLESLDQTHPKLTEWRRRLRRGGSMKLLADAPYASSFSENWNLSLNVPDSVLGELRRN